MKPRYGVSFSADYLNGSVVIRDFGDSQSRIFAIIPRNDRAEAEQIAQQICDCLNKRDQVSTTVT